MPLLARQVIEHMRDQHPAFGPERAPNGVCLRYLTRWQQRFAATIAAIRPEKIATTVLVPLPLPDFAAGATLPVGCDFPLEVQAVAGARTVPVEVVSFRHRMDPLRMPAVSVVGASVLTLLGTPEDWHGYSALVLRYVPQPGPVETLDAALWVPSDALDVASASLAAFIAGRVTTDSEFPVDVGLFVQERAEAEVRYVEALKLPSGSQTLRIAERW